MKVWHAARVSLVVCSLVLAGLARGEPSDPMSDDLPAFDSPWPEAEPFEVGDYNVNAKSGAAGYSFAIRVPPGRQGMEPSIALAYNSQAPLRGGVAAGWSLDLPVIKKDLAPALLEEARYTVQFASSSGTLVVVSDAAINAGAVTYRLELDEAFTRFEFWPSTTTWVAYTTDGATHHFESGDRIGQWRLSRQVDRFGNRIDYTWEAYSIAGVAADYYITWINYGANDGAGLGHHAEIEFQYDSQPGTCLPSQIPVGARVDYGITNDLRSVPYAEGARKLVAVKTSVRDVPGGSPRTVRKVQLGYDTTAESCTGEKAPLRILRSITESATDAAGVTTTLQPITFTYGGFDPRSVTTTVVPSGYVNHGVRSPMKTETLKSLIDFNGDGVVDVISVDASCRLFVDYGPLGAPSSVATFALPLMPWPDSTVDNGMYALPRYNGTPVGGLCSLDGQEVRRTTEEPYPPEGSLTPCEQKGSFLHYSFVDYNGDGRTDLLTYFAEERDYYHREEDALFPSTDVPADELPCIEGSPGPATEPTTCHGAQPVGETRCGMPVWRVYLNDGDEFVFHRGHLMPVPMTPDGAKTSVGLGRGAYRSGIHGLLDIDGDRKLDIVWRGDPSFPKACASDQWDVFPGDGSGRWYVDDLSCWRVPPLES